MTSREEREKPTWGPIQSKELDTGWPREPSSFRAHTRVEEAAAAGELGCREVGEEEAAADELGCHEEGEEGRCGGGGRRFRAVRA